MRGIGQGQTIHLLIIPEVANRIVSDLEGQEMLWQMVESHSDAVRTVSKEEELEEELGAVVEAVNVKVDLVLREEHDDVNELQETIENAKDAAAMLDGAGKHEHAAEMVKIVKELEVAKLLRLPFFQGKLELKQAVMDAKKTLEGFNATGKDLSSAAENMHELAKQLKDDRMQEAWVAAKRVEKLAGALENKMWRLMVPAWLLVNSMRSESMQFSMLSLQEVDNVFRKIALSRLKSAFEGWNESTPLSLLEDAGIDTIQPAISQFETVVDHCVACCVPVPEGLAASIAAIVQDSTERLLGGSELPHDTKELVAMIQSRHATSSPKEESTIPSQLDGEREQVMLASLDVCEVLVCHRSSNRNRSSSSMRSNRRSSIRCLNSPEIPKIHSSGP